MPRPLKITGMAIAATVVLAALYVAGSVASGKTIQKALGIAHEQKVVDADPRISRQQADDVFRTATAQLTPLPAGLHWPANVPGDGDPTYESDGQGHERLAGNFFRREFTIQRAQEMFDCAWKRDIYQHRNDPAQVQAGLRDLRIPTHKDHIKIVPLDGNHQGRGPNQFDAMDKGDFAPLGREVDESDPHGACAIALHMFAARPAA